MKITLEFSTGSTGQELDCRMLEGAMTAMSRCLLNHLSSDVVSEPAAEGDALEEVSAEAVAPVEEKPLVVQPKARKPRKSTKTEKKEAEPALSAESPADSEGEGEAPQTKQEQSDLPFAEGEENKPEPKPETAPVPQSEPAPQPTVSTMTAAEFRQKLVELRAQLGVEMETPQALQLSRVISARCNHLYGTTKPSTLPGDKLYEFVHNEMMNLTWNADHTDFEDPMPF